MRLRFGGRRAGKHRVLRASTLAKVQQGVHLHLVSPVGVVCYNGFCEEKETAKGQKSLIRSNAEELKRSMKRMGEI